MEKSDLVIGKVYFHKLGGVEVLYLGDMSVTKDTAYYFRFMDYEGKFQSSAFLLEEIEEEEHKIAPSYEEFIARERELGRDTGEGRKAL